MIPSLIGLAVFAVVYFVGWCLGSGPLVGLMVSISLGSTAFVQLPVVGGSSPLIYALFVLILCARTFVRAGAISDLRALFARERAAWIVSCLMLVAIVVTIVAPRLFAGESVALLPVDRIYTEFPLGPSSKNISQGGYFLLSAVTYFAVSLLLLRNPRRELITKAFFALCVAHTACGVVDLVAKRLGESDVFAPIRTASYSMLSDAVMAGFPRLTGAMPEASTFALMVLSCIGFSYVYWRATGSPLALGLTVANLVLAFLSTSTTAYVGLVVLGFPVAWRIFQSFRTGVRPAPRDLQIIAHASLAAVISFGVFATYDRPAAILDLASDTVLQKATSDSGVERMYFNRVSVRNFIDTGGVGVGLGSSRSSSWPLAVLGQLGAIGVVLTGLLLFIVLRAMNGVRETPQNAGLIVVGNSACAAAVGGLVAASISGGSADPGVIFFVAVAVVTSWRWHALREGATTEERSRL